jgi:hypothetical protein
LLIKERIFFKNGNGWLGREGTQPVGEPQKTLKNIAFIDATGCGVAPQCCIGQHQQRRPVLEWTDSACFIAV